ncbi:PREDICTED: protein bottleneck [Drosophila arizonae]|uniref:Protein bottleneck n=1 Tax=Drosophila arizonae TaxID=7263 RepID=A0ABM1Q3R5_DROAR|nr:PREDICTED: protein bottleneck [Drosophila arizonae]
MSISTFNFQFYNYKLPAAMPQLNAANSFSELEMDIDEEEEQQLQQTPPPITSTPLPAPLAKPRYTSALSLAVGSPDVSKTPTPSLRPQLHRPQKRWSMELREKVLEMSKRNNASDEKLSSPPQPQSQPQPQPLSADCNATFCASSEQPDEPAAVITRSVSDKINFFNRLTNTYESSSGHCSSKNSNHFISLLRSSRPQGVATMGSNGVVPPPKPKRLGSTPSTPNNTAAQHSLFATPTAKPPSNGGSSIQRKSSLRRKPSVEKSRATIARQNSNATLRPQRHAMMEDLSLVVPVRLRIAEYEQRISMSA